MRNSNLFICAFIGLLKCDIFPKFIQFVITTGKFFVCSFFVYPPPPLPRGSKNKQAVHQVLKVITLSPPQIQYLIQITKLVVMESTTNTITKEGTHQLQVVQQKTIRTCLIGRAPNNRLSYSSTPSSAFASLASCILHFPRISIFRDSSTNHRSGASTLAPAWFLLPPRAYPQSTDLPSNA
jgi:hypothetical protein